MTALDDAPPPAPAEPTPDESETVVVSGEDAQKRGLTGYVLLLPGFVWLILFFIVPTVTLLGSSLYDPAGSLFSGYKQTFAASNYVEAMSAYAPVLGRSFFYALLATIACIVLGYPAGVRDRVQGRAVAQPDAGAVIAPFFTSFLVRTLSWKLLLADQGWSRTLRDLHLSAPTRACWPRRSRW